MSEMHPSHDDATAAPIASDAPAGGVSQDSPNHQNTKSPNRSREMLGGPVVGVVVFLLIAVILGWVATKIIQGQMRNAQQDSLGEVEHSFDLRATYILKRDALLGWDAREQLTLYPDKLDLPHGTPNRRIATRIDDYRAAQETGDDRYSEVVGVLEAGTHLRVLEVIDDADNHQTRLRLRVEILTGPHAGKKPIALYLGSMSISDAGITQYKPREAMLDLLLPAGSASDAVEPIQSDEPQAPSEQP